VRNRHKNLRYFSLGFVVTAMFVGILNWTVDPYGIYGVSIEGVNTAKYAISNHMRLHMAVAVEKIAPQSLIIGTSRAGLGLDENHPGFTAKPVYNLNMPAARMYELLRYLQHAQAVRPLKQVVMGLDFLSFKAAGGEYVGDFDDGRLASNSRNWAVRRLPDLVATLYSIDVLAASLGTLIVRNDTCLPRVAPAGYGVDTVAANQCKVARTGHRKMFLDSEQEFLLDLYAKYDFTSRTSGRSSFAIFREVLRFARRHDIDLRLAILPVHARQLMVIDIAGLWPAYERWKRTVVAIVAEDANEHGGNAYPMWDFSGFNHVSTEPVPGPRDNKNQMTWFWESSHFKKSLGNYLLDRVLGTETAAPRPKPDVGVRINTANIEERLRDARAGKRDYQQNNRTDHTEIVAIKKDIDG